VQVFCGPYIPGKKERDEFNGHYQKMAEGFLSFPINLPGTGLLAISYLSPFMLQVCGMPSAPAMLLPTH
jgi:hypothetical protein